MPRSSRTESLRSAGRLAPAAGPRGSALEVAALGLDGGPGAVAYVVLKYFQAAFQCFSEWTRDELRAFSEFNRKVSSLTWPQIYSSGGKGGGKSGLGYTAHDGTALPPLTLASTLSEDISWCEMRVTQKARVHGFRAGQGFFLVFLDRNHDVFPA